MKKMLQKCQIEADFFQESGFSPEKFLFASILTRAVADLALPASNHDHRSAVKWFSGVLSHIEVVSFEKCCEVLGINHKRVLSLLKETSANEIIDRRPVRRLHSLI